LKFAQICQKQALKYTIFVNIQKRPNGQTILFLANSFKKANWQPWPYLALKDDFLLLKELKSDFKKAKGVL
jgi:hypothetical protein